MIGDLLVEDGKIAAVGTCLDADGAEAVDAAGLIVAPGLVDIHTHLREPGFEAKEDIISGTKAAANGGVTTVACMPNTKPVVDNAAIVEAIEQSAKRESYANVKVIGAISKGEKGEELAEMGDMAEKGAVAFSDDGQFVRSSRLFLLAAEYIRSFDKPLLCHSIDPELEAGGYMHEGEVSARTGIPGIPSVSEDIAVARDCIIAQYTGAHVHICHVASKGALEIIRAFKAKGAPVTCEVTAHHLTLTDEMCSGFDASCRVSPPLRSREHVQALIDGVLDGTVDCIVTDHAAHASEEKDVEFRKAPNGFPGLELSLGVILTELYHKGVLDLMTVISKMSTEPAKVLGLDAGTLKKGAPADIVLIDPEKAWTVDSSKLYTKGKFTPFEGRKLMGRAVATMLGGNFVMKNGEICATNKKAA